MFTLLHVEDDPDIREIAELALGLTGAFELIQCDSGEAALSYAQTNTPDVILLDMMMPGLSGPQTLEALRQLPHLREVPAIFMTARAQQNDIDTMHEIGAAGVISKPFDPMTLSDQILAIIAPLLSHRGAA